MSVQRIPPGMDRVIPHLVVQGGMEALEFYKEAFNAEAGLCMTGPDGKTLMHGEFRIGPSTIFLAEEFPGTNTSSPKSLKGTTVSLMLYFQDVDQAFQQAVAAGAKPIMPPGKHVLGRPLRQGGRPLRPLLGPGQPH